MRQIIQFFAAGFLIIVFNSCHKNHDNEDSPIDQNDSLSICADVFYKDFIPDTIINFPYLNTLVFDLKVNSDSIPDIRFNLNHHNWNYGPHIYDSYLIWMDSLNSMQFIATNYCDGPCSWALDSNDIICDTNKIVSHFELFRKTMENSLECGCFSTMGFVGFKFKNANNIFYGWIRLKADYSGLLINDFAICNCPNKPIKIGYH